MSLEKLEARDAAAAKAPHPLREAIGRIPTRDELIAMVMEETTDEILRDGWSVLGRPNILIQGCRYVRNNPAHGYVNPEGAAREFAGLIADRFLSTLQPPPGAVEIAREALRDGAAWFREYEVQHGAEADHLEVERASCISPQAFAEQTARLLDKRTKAERSGERAERLEAALSALSPSPSSPEGGR